MPLQASGTIKLSEIATQFGGSGPHKLSEYNRGGSLVFDTSVNANIATSGNPNKLTNYYSTGNPRVTVLQTQTGNAQLLNGVTVNTDSTELSDNTRLLIGMSYSAGTGSTGSTCTITGKTVTEQFDVGNFDDGDRQTSSHYSCNLGNVSSFYLTLTRASTGRGGRAVVMQVDNCGDVSSPLTSTTGSGSAARTLSISDGAGISFYVGQTSFDSLTSTHGFFTFTNMVAASTDMTEIFPTQTGAVGGQITYLSSGSHPTGSVTFQMKPGTCFCSKCASVTCQLGGTKMCCGVSYYAF
jgi:hypothetical protein